MSRITPSGIPERLGISPEVKEREGLDGYCFSADKGMWYYDVFSRPGSGPTVYRSLLSSAESKIDMWDPYLHPSDADLFSDVPRQIDIRILTCFGATASELANFEFKEDYRGFVERINFWQAQRHFGLKIAIINSRKCSDFGKGKLPHDRFLFIDKEAYLVGSSLQYHSEEQQGQWLTTVKNTMICKVSEKENRDILYQAFSNFWNDRHEYYRRYVDVIVDKIGEGNV